MPDPETGAAATTTGRESLTLTESRARTPAELLPDDSVAEPGSQKTDHRRGHPPLRGRAKSLYEELAEQPAQDTRWNEYLVSRGNPWWVAPHL